MFTFFRCCVWAYGSLLFLLVFGVVVRATGSGLGCPDWPFCYGRWVPPLSVDDIDFNQININKFKEKIAKMGGDPSRVSVESLRQGFDVKKTWIEYLNRLTSFPVAISCLVLMLLSFKKEVRSTTRWLTVGAVGGVILVGLNAWLGARVVMSGLQPGVITLHMALAMLLLCVLVGMMVVARKKMNGSSGMEVSKMQWIGCWVLLACVFIECLLGSQVRELTDGYAMKDINKTRAEWSMVLGNESVYLWHRSCSWVILGLSSWLWMLLREIEQKWLIHAVMGLVIFQMILGIFFSHVAVYEISQILHFVFSALLISAVFALSLWNQPKRKMGRV
jgi:cytochrome c oxidase assembly protein subunit 15